MERSGYAGQLRFLSCNYNTNIKKQPYQPLSFNKHNRFKQIHKLRSL